MSKELMDYFNKQPRLGTLSTANKEGQVDVAYFGSAQMVDEIILPGRTRQKIIEALELTANKHEALPPRAKGHGTSPT